MTPDQLARLDQLGWSAPHWQAAVRSHPNRATCFNTKLAQAATIQTTEDKPAAFARLYRYALKISKVRS